LPFVKGKAKTGLDSFLTVAGKLDRRVDDGEAVTSLIYGILELSGLGDYHREQDEIQNSTKLQNLDELVNAGAHPPDSDAPYAGREGLAAFLETVELDTAGLSEEDGEAKITLITMHNTKGLEFDRVFVTGLEDGLFPRDETAHDRDELEEERRL